LVTEGKGFLDGCSLLIVVGEGGVGKTSIAAGLAGILACEGKRVLCMTVDPSNRLRTALGLKGECGIEEDVSLDFFGCRGLGGVFRAMVLDAKSELRKLISQFVKDEESRERILKNPFFKEAARLSGTHEYMAMLRVFEALQGGCYDLVILDTPPDEHAGQFLDAPQRVQNLLSNEVFGRFVSASSGVSKVGLKVLRWRRLIMGGLARIAGQDAVFSVLDFMLSLAPIFDLVRERAKAVRQMVLGPKASAVVVLRPSSRCEDGLVSQISLLRSRGIKVSGVFANKVYLWEDETFLNIGVDKINDAFALDPAFGLLAHQEVQRLASQCIMLAAMFREMAERDRANIEKCRKQLESTPVFVVPLMKQDVGDLESLAEFSRVLKMSMQSFASRREG
jgi:anion-transporting  ArsA/GET3 family ATPase